MAFFPLFALMQKGEQKNQGTLRQAQDDRRNSAALSCQCTDEQSLYCDPFFDSLVVVLCADNAGAGIPPLKL